MNFTGTGTSPNGAVTYSWDFGSTQQNPSHLFTCGVFDPVLTVTDPLGCIGTDTVRIEVPCLDAAFTSTSTNGCTSIPMQFTDASNFASAWSWNFGDAGTSTLQNPTHTYSASGTYTVTLTNGTCIGSNTTSMTVGTPVGSVGNYVWNDTNSDGIQNEPASAGINGVTVKLFQETAPGTYTNTQTTTTANNTSGNPGYYNFVITAAANYYVQFPIAVGSNFYLDRGFHG